MKNLKKYISPKLVIQSLKSGYQDLKYFKKFKSILKELEKEGKLKTIGFKLKDDKLFVGVNLNPDLLRYTDDSQESVELKFISEAMKKYTDFLQNEGILDSIVADYERIFNEDFYGYIVQIRYKFKNYNKKEMIYSVSYLATMFIVSIATALIAYSYIL